MVSAYLDHRDLAELENRAERFFINLVLVRVLYAHTLVAAPSVALGWLAPLAPLLGDPRLGMTGTFLSLSRILPGRYPLIDDLDTYIRSEHGFGHLLDVGIITPRLPLLYHWSATELARSDLNDLLTEGTPAYAWPADDRNPWQPSPTLLALAARRALPRPRRDVRSAPSRLRAVPGEPVGRVGGVPTAGRGGGFEWSRAGRSAKSGVDAVRRDATDWCTPSCRATSPSSHPASSASSMRWTGLMDHVR